MEFYISNEHSNKFQIHSNTFQNTQIKLEDCRSEDVMKKTAAFIVASQLCLESHMVQIVAFIQH